jgi:hypothetical protein
MKEPYLLLGFDHVVLWLPRRYSDLDGDDADDAIYEPTRDRLTEDGRFPPDEGFRWFCPRKGARKALPSRPARSGIRSSPPCTAPSR